MKAFTSDNNVRHSLSVAIITLVLNIFFFTGMQATDDLSYAEKAFKVLDQGLYFADTSHQVGRVGAYLPLAGVFGLFGINEFSLSLIPIVSSVVTSVLIFFLGKILFESSVGLMAGILYAVFPLTLKYGNIFFPETILGPSLCGASILFLKSNNSGRGMYNPMKMASGLLVGFAYLTTEVGAVMLPTFLLYKFIRRKIDRDDVSLAFGFIIVLCAELLFYGILYSNPFYRFTGLGGTYISDPMLIDANNDLFDRLFKAYPRYFFYPKEELGFFGPLLIAGVVKGVLNFKKNLFLLAWAAAILGFYNFMTVRLDHYIALPVAVRLIYPGCFPLLILSAKFMVDIWQRIGMGAVGVKRVLQGVYIGAVTGMVVTSMLLVHLNKNIGFTSVIARNAEETAYFLKKEPRVVLVSDKRTLAAISFYRGFSTADTLMDFEEYSQLGVKSTRSQHMKVLTVINGPIYNILEGTSGFFPFVKTRKDLMQAAISSSPNVVFRSKFNKGYMFHSLDSWGLLQKLLSEWSYRLAKKLILGEDAQGWVIILSDKITSPL